MEHRMNAEHSPGSQEHSPLARMVYSIDEFCRAHGISRSKIYQLWGQGRGPKVMKVDGKRLITIEAATAWRAELQTEAPRKA